MSCSTSAYMHVCQWFVLFLSLLIARKTDSPTHDNDASNSGSRFRLIVNNAIMAWKKPDFYFIIGHVHHLIYITRRANDILDIAWYNSKRKTRLRLAKRWTTDDGGLIFIFSDIIYRKSIFHCLLIYDWLVIYVYVNLPLGAESPLSIKWSGLIVYNISAENHLNCK